jgi:Cof subfamily protein (haloacid dehalogenase superfamily)
VTVPSFIPPRAGSATLDGRRGFDPGPAPVMVVTDMDGTLLDETGDRVSQRNIDALTRAGEAGARVVIATGRPIWWLGPVIEAGFTGTAVCMNGAVVYDVAAGEIIASSPLTSLTMRNFVGALQQQTDEFAIAVERLGITIQACIAEEQYDHPWAFGLFQRADRATVLSEPAAKLLVRGTGDSRSLALAARSAGADAVHITYSTDDGLIEVAAAGVNKGSALAALAVRWGIDAKDVIAFGDMPNDLEMLHWAGFGVAMGNAHPDVAAIASEIGAHHHEDGVAQILERWF